MHDAFVTAWTNWASLRDQALFERWFQRIVVNTCRDRLRRGARWQVRDISTELALAAPDAYARSDDRDAIDVAMARLGPMTGSCSHSATTATSWSTTSPGSSSSHPGR